MQDMDLLKLFTGGGIALAILGVSCKIIMYLVQEVKQMYDKSMSDAKEREKALMEHSKSSNDKLQTISENQSKISENQSRISENQSKIASKLDDIDNRVSNIEKTLEIKNKNLGG